MLNKKILAIIGRIRPNTRVPASREVIPVPLFGVLKHLLPFKRVMVERAKEMQVP
jgi:hypothetical protein